MLKIKFQKINEDAIIPNYAHKGDAGLDMYSEEDDYVLKPGEIKGFKTGIKIEIPFGYVGLFWDKSGLALKNGIKTMGGVIDSTYRGELIVILNNLGKKEYVVEKKSKIAQLLVQKIEEVEFEEVSNLEYTERGEGGFGSSGVK
jgi:dUTP pyrophosphatase